MPRYEYRCYHCGHTEEKWRPVPARDLLGQCLVCDRPALKRMFTARVTIAIPEAFRHNQADFLPPKGDPKWDDMVHVSEVRERQKTEVQDGFKRALESEFLTE
jgi:putative FmdB family regulatory protein